MAELVTLARPYAKAAFEAAFAESKLAAWQGMLDALAAVVVHKKMAVALSQPSLTSGQQAGLLLEVCGDAVSERGANLVRVLAGNKRISLLPEIAAQFGRLKAEAEKTLAVEVRTAFPLDAAVAERLTQALSKKWQCQVSLETQVDSALLGGAIIKAGDTVIDASVRGRILKLADALGA